MVVGRPGPAGLNAVYDVAAVFKEELELAQTLRQSTVDKLALDQPPREWNVVLLVQVPLPLLYNDILKFSNQRFQS